MTEQKWYKNKIIQNVPSFSFQSFLLKMIPTIFSVPNFQNHQSYNKYVVTEKERRLFSLKGSDPANRAARMKFYKFMLEHMTDEHRILSTNRLCSDILNACVEGTIKLKDPGAFDLLKVRHTNDFIFRDSDFWVKEDT